LLALGSDGLHSNGFSLVRRLAADFDWAMDAPAPFDPERKLIDTLIEPTRIYVESLLPIIRDGLVHGLAHITGGGLLENITRILPEGAHAAVNADSWRQPGLMAFLQEQGSIAPEEMARTFNCGVGMMLAVAPDAEAEVTERLAAAGETIVPVGTIEAGKRGCTVRGSSGTWASAEAWEAVHLG
ncbi:MAG: AIR synthase-related protein, partial [Pseudomonadota bacterium]